MTYIKIRNYLLFIVLLVFYMASSFSLLSQPKKGMYGITVAISKGFESTQNISTNTGSLNIGMAYMPSDKLSLRGELGFRSYKDTTGARSSEFTFTANMWYCSYNRKCLDIPGRCSRFWFCQRCCRKRNQPFKPRWIFWSRILVQSQLFLYGHIGIVYASYTVAERPASDVFTSATTGLTWYL